MKKQNSKYLISNIKSSKGITLIALIITIIVLLIIAMVAVGAVKDSDIIGHAGKTASDYKIAQEKEELNLAIAEWQMQNAIPGNSESFESFMTTALQDKVKKITPNGDGSLRVRFNTDNEYTVTEKGEIKQENIGGSNNSDNPVISSDKDVWQTDGNGTILAFLGTEQSVEVDRLYDELCEDFNSNVEVAKIFGDKQNIVEKWVENTKKSVEIAKQIEDGSYFNNIPNLYPIIESEERTCL